jgi:hypothetical protein
MKRSITRDLKEVCFHDSTIKRFVRTGDTVTLTFDWAYLTYESTPLIVGICCLNLFRVVSDEVSPEKHGPECLGVEYSLIGTNSSESDNDLVLGGFFESATEYSWVEWRCRFESFKFEWEGDVSLEAWRNGKLPEAESGRDGRIAPATPPTPPGMRLRTGRFQ